MELEEIHLSNICGGAAAEVFARELGELLKNIKDPSTDAEKKRRLTLMFDFAPLADRSGADVSFSCKSSLVPVQTIRSSIFVSEKGGKLRAYSTDIKQGVLFQEKETQDDGKLRAVKP